MKQLILNCTFISLTANLCFASNIVGVTKNTESGTPKVISIPMEDGQEVPSQQQLQQAVMPKTEHRNLYPAEQLSYLTVCLSFKSSNAVSSATGFYYSIPHPTNPTLHIPVIISNKHATKDALETKIVLTLSSNSLPSMQSFPITIINRTNPWINHPDPSIDLSVLPIGALLNELELHGVVPFIAPMDSSLIPDDDYMKTITQTDEVIMIGYPGGLRDEVNNQPIFRKGILATSPSKNFGGERKFLIDMPVYGGSSGSPVLLFSETAHLERGGTQPGIHFSGRLKLIGINAATFTSTETGMIVQIPVPTVVENNIDEITESSTNATISTQYLLGTLTRIPNNIGVVIHASCLKDMETYVASRVLGGVDNE